jgi:hypothetical protein
MLTYKNQLIAVQTDISNLNTLYTQIDNAKTNAELDSLEITLKMYERVY